MDKSEQQNEAFVKDQIKQWNKECNIFMVQKGKNYKNHEYQSLQEASRQKNEVYQESNTTTTE